MAVYLSKMAFTMVGTKSFSALCHFGPCGKTFQPDLNQTHKQDNLRLRQGGMCLGNMV